MSAHASITVQFKPHRLIVLRDNAGIWVARLYRDGEDQVPVVVARSTPDVPGSAAHISLEGGEPFMPTPDFVKEAMKSALDQNQTRYAPSSGIPPLLDAICAKLRAKNRIDVETMAPLAARTLALNEIGVANLWTAHPLAFEPYEKSRDLGGFILIDPVSARTIAAGLIRFGLRRADNLHEQASAVTPERRAALMGQRPKLLWFTGLSGAGKSTIANLVEAKLHAAGRHTFLLDGDNVRLGLNRDLGFTDADRVENIRRVGEAAKLMMDAGLIVITAFISPFRSERAMARALVPEGDFVEIFVDTPLAEAERRDTKGLYAKAREGRLANFTGIDSPYEAPEAPEIRIDTMAMSAEEAAEAIVNVLASHTSPRL